MGANPDLNEVVPFANLPARKKGGSDAFIWYCSRFQFCSRGGLVRGPSTGTSDSIPALLSNGEFVLTKEAVDRIGVNTLNMLNNTSRFANGGLVGSRGGGGRRAAPLGNTTHIDTPTINITIESGAGENDEELAQRTAKAVRDQMRNLVREEVIDMQRSGNPLGRER